MPETQQAIDWQAEYQKKDEMYKELVRLIAKKNCDYHSLRAKFLLMRKECASEKERADEMKDILLDAIGTLAMRGNKEDADRIADKLRNVGADKL